MTPVITSYEPFSRQPEYVEVNRGFIRSLPLEHCRSLLDLACGTGTLTDLVLEHHPVRRVTGLDLSRESLALAVEHFRLPGVAGHDPEQPAALPRGRTVHFLEGSADYLPLQPERFEAVIMGNSFHNLPDQDLLLREIHRVLRPGGTFAFNTSFFAGTFPPGTETLYHEWLKLALGWIREQDTALREAGEPGIKRRKGTSHRAFSRKWPTPEEFCQLCERNGLEVDWYSHRTIYLDGESLEKVGAYSEMARVLLSGYPVEIASEALARAARPAFVNFGSNSVRRLWLEVVARKK